MIEEWRDIEGYEGLYKVSNTGKVLNCLTNRVTKYRTSNWYKSVNLRKCGVYKKFYVHRLVANAFIPNPNKLPIVNHINSNRANNNVDNLEWVTQKENMIHRFKAAKARQLA